MDWYPLEFDPILKPKTWGGRRLETLLGKSLPPGEMVGESWEVSDYPGEVSVVAAGPLAGRSLHELMEADVEGLLGRPLLPREGGRFPLLVKFIDAKDVLSLQVHPSDEQASELGGGHRGKTECWYVVEADPGSVLYLGVRPGVTREELAAALRREVREEIEELLNTMEARPGDLFFAPAGTVHAIGAGMLFAEVSQTSDSTLRLYDWGRLPRRPTHLEEGLKVLDLPAEGPGRAGRCEPRPVDDCRDRLLECRAFTVDRLRLPAGARRELPGSGLAEVWMTITGAGVLSCAARRARLTAGRTFLVPAGAPPAVIEAHDDLTLLTVQPAR